MSNKTFGCLSRIIDFNPLGIVPVAGLGQRAYGIETRDSGLIATFKSEEKAAAFTALHNEGIRMRHNPNYLFECVVARIVDGDTIDVIVDQGFYVSSQQRIRLRGIDTPELSPRKGTPEERKIEREAALKAKAFVESQCPVGSMIFMYSHKAGEYGRFLGEIYLSADAEESLNEILLKEGHAKKYTK